jgi:cation diffusion facilitator CzcD-associated flavoprotein CzcO
VSSILDIPSHVYQYTFEPYPRWSKYFSPGSEILEYVKRTAAKYKIDTKVKYNTKVVGAIWNEDSGTWTVNTEHTSSEDSNVPPIQGTQDFEVVISATGLLNSYKWPEIPGLETFEGVKMHSANWDASW